MPRFHYTLTGAIDVPEGSRLSETGSEILLPDGTGLKVWDTWEEHHLEADTHRELDWSDMQEKGCFYDGDTAVFEEVESTDQLWPPES